MHLTSSGNHKIETTDGKYVRRVMKDKTIPNKNLIEGNRTNDKRLGSLKLKRQDFRSGIRATNKDMNCTKAIVNCRGD